jgi:dTMP kinase
VDVLTLKALLQKGGVNHFSIGLLFAADRMWHLLEDPSLPGPGVLGAIDRGYVVVTDRYKYSSMAYQGSFTGIDYIRLINSKAVEADIIVYIDVPVEVALKRIRERGKKPDIYEKLELLNKVKESFGKVLERAREEGAEVIVVEPMDGGREKPIEEVQGEIRRRVMKSLNSLVESSP